MKSEPEAGPAPAREADSPGADAREAEAREAEARLAQHLRHLGRMYPVLAHDLHGFLNTMVLNLELLQRTAAREEQDADSVARIRRYAALVADEIPPLDRMLKAFVGQMRLAEPPSTRFDLRTLCEELAVLFDSYGRHRRVRVRSTLADVPMAVVGDRDAAAHALTSLLLGAVDGLPAGSLLALTLQAGRSTAVLALASEPSDPGVPVAAPLAEPTAAVRAMLERLGAHMELPHGPRDPARLEITLPLAPLGA